MPHYSNRTNHQNRNNNRNRNNQKKFDEKAKDYIEPVSKLLDIENATASEVKIAIEKIEYAIKEINNERDSDIVKTHQIRTMFSLLKEIKDEKKLYEIMPRLKYIGARQKGESGKFIVGLIELLIGKIEKNTETEKKTLIKGLLYIMESIIAYHKFHINK